MQLVSSPIKKKKKKKKKCERRKTKQSDGRAGYSVLHSVFGKVFQAVGYISRLIDNEAIAPRSAIVFFFFFFFFPFC
jgi:hypothetical protein